MPAKPLNIGMIGYGFMGRAHSNAYANVNHYFDLPMRPVLKAACARSADKVKPFAEQWGYESIETDWRKLVERKDIDAIDICTPNNTHAEIALAAAAAGKMILCEKPLAMNGPEGLKMVVNYGLDSVRFIQPVKVDSQVRLKVDLAEVTEKKPGQWLLKAIATLEIEGEEKPAYIAESLSLCFV